MSLWGHWEHWVALGSVALGTVVALGALGTASLGTLVALGDRNSGHEVAVKGLAMPFCV